MIVLGTSNEDKGNQLEKLTLRFLADKGHPRTNVSLIGHEGEQGNVGTRRENRRFEDFQQDSCCPKQETPGTLRAPRLT